MGSYSLPASVTSFDGISGPRQGEFMKLEDAVRAEVSEIYGYDNLSARDSAEGES